MVCMVVVMIVDPPGEPITIKGLLSLSTMVGVIEESGLFPGSTAFASFPINPNALGTAANYNDQAIDLGTGVSYQGLPPFNQSLFNELDIIQNSISTTQLTLCDGENYVLGYEPVAGALYSWYKDGNLIPEPKEDLNLDLLSILVDADKAGHAATSPAPLLCS